MIAKWRRPGITSRKSSSRLPAISAAWDDRPVTLPPGRARLGTKLRRNFGQSFVFPLGRAPFADEILAFDITELTHPLSESGIYVGKSFARHYDRNPNAP